MLFHKYWLQIFDFLKSETRINATDFSGSQDLCSGMTPRVNSKESAQLKKPEANLHIYLFVIVMCVAAISPGRLLAAELKTQIWQTIGQTGFSRGEITEPNLVVAPGAIQPPFVAFVDESTGFDFFEVYDFDGTNWTSSRNDDPIGSGYGITQTVDANGNRYIAFADGFNPGDLKVLLGSSASWPNVTDGGNDTIANVKRTVTTPIVADSNGNLFVAYKDESGGAADGKAVVQAYDGTNWNVLGVEGISTGEVGNVSLAIDTADKLYLAFQDLGNDDDATVVTWTGTEWQSVGTAGITGGESENVQVAISPEGDTPYLLYKEIIRNGQNTSSSLKLKVYDTANNRWSDIDTGLDPGDGYLDFMQTSLRAEPVIAYKDGNSVKVQRYNGTQWLSVGPSTAATLDTDEFAFAIGNDNTPYILYQNPDTNKASVVRLVDSDLAADFTDPTLEDENLWLGSLVKVEGTADSTQLTLTVTLSDVAAGTIAATTFGNATFSFVNGVATITGTAVEINAVLETLFLVPAANYFGSDYSVSFQVTDGTNTSNVITSVIVIGAVNDAPTITDGSDMTIIEDTPTPLDLTGIRVSDVENDEVTLTIVGSRGSLTTSNDGSSIGDGLTITAEDLNGVARFRLTGSVTDINTYLAIPNVILYTPPADAFGTNAVTVSFNVSDSDPGARTLFRINITGTNDAPRIGAELWTEVSQFDTQTQAFFVITDEGNSSANLELGDTSDEFMGRDSQGRIYVAGAYDKQASSASSSRIDRIAAFVYGNSGWQQTGDIYESQYRSRSAHRLGLDEVDVDNDSKLWRLYTDRGGRIVEDDEGDDEFETQEGNLRIDYWDGSQWQVARSVNGTDFEDRRDFAAHSSTNAYYTYVQDGFDRDVDDITDAWKFEQYNGSSWTPLPARNYDPVQASPVMEVDNQGNLLVAYRDGANLGGITVIKYDDTADQWQILGQPNLTGRQSESAEDVWPTGIYFDGNNKAYLSYRDDTGNAHYLMSFDQTNGWQQVGTTPVVSGLSTTAASLAFNDSGNPYMVVGARPVTVVAYIDNSWQVQGNEKADFDSISASNTLISFVDDQTIPSVVTGSSGKFSVGQIQAQQMPDTTHNYTEDTAGSLFLPNQFVSDPDGDDITLTIALSDAAAGSLSCANGGDASVSNTGLVWTVSGTGDQVNTAKDCFVYTPTANYFGSDYSVALSLTDGELTNGPVTITLNVISVNDPPTFSITDSPITVAEGEAVQITSAHISGSDLESTAADLDYTFVTAPANGQFQFDTNADGIPEQRATRFTQADVDDGKLYYVHDGGETSTDSVTLNFADGGGINGGGAFLNQVLTFTVTPVNDVPELMVREELKFVEWFGSYKGDSTPEMDDTRFNLVSDDGLHVYASSVDDDAITHFTRNTETGQLTPFAVYKNGQDSITRLDGPIGMAIVDNGTTLIAVAAVGDGFVVFSRDTTTGALTYVNSYRDGGQDDMSNVIDGLNGAQRVVFSPDEQFFYISAYTEDEISMYQYNSQNRAVTYLGIVKDGTSGVDALNEIQNMVFTKDGAYLYTGGDADNDIGVFSRDASTGLLTFEERIGLSSPLSIALTPDDSQLIAISIAGDSVSVYDRNPDDGSLTLSSSVSDGTSFDVRDPETGEISTIVTKLNGPYGVHIDSIGRYVYVAANFEDSFNVFERDPVTGELSLVAVFSHNDEEGQLGLDVVRFSSSSPDESSVYTSSGENSNGFGSHSISVFHRTTVAASDFKQFFAEDSGVTSWLTRDLSISDAENGSQYTVTLTLPSATAGVLAAEAVGNATVTFENGVLTVTGNLQDVNDTLRTIQFTPSADFDSDNDAIIFVVNDGEDNSEAISVILLPTERNNDPFELSVNQTLTVDEGTTNALSNTVLQATDPDVTDVLTFTLTTAPANGFLFLDANDNGTHDSAEAIATDGTGTFTQQNIDDGNLYYSHNGSETTSDSFIFDLDDVNSDDSFGTTDPLTAQTFNFAITPVNDAPEITEQQWVDVTGSAINSFSLGSFSEGEFAYSPDGTLYFLHRNGGGLYVRFNDTTTNTWNTSIPRVTQAADEPIDIEIDSAGVVYVSYIIDELGYVERYVNGNWERLGATAISADKIDHLVIKLNSSDQVVAAYETVSGNVLEVLTFDGTTWQDVGTGSITTSGVSGSTLQIASNDELYIAYRDFADNSIGKVTVFREGAWSELSPGAFNSSLTLSLSFALDHNDVPFVYFTELDEPKGVVVKLENDQWVTVGNAFFLESTRYSTLALSPTGTPYLAYALSSGDFRNLANVAVLDSGSNTWGGTGDVYQGLRTSLTTTDISLAVSPTGVPVVFFIGRTGFARELSRSGIVNFTVDINEDTGATAIFEDAVISDAEGDSVSFTLTLSNVGAGTLSGAAVGNAIFSNVNGVITVTGTALEASQTLNAITFTPTDGYFGTTDTLTLAVQDSNAATAQNIVATINMIDINEAPVVTTNTGFDVLVGAEKTITSAELQTTDADVGDTPDQLTYRIVSSSANGRLRLNGNNIGNNSTFTQADINNNLLSYLHDGGPSTQDSFAFSVQDGLEDGVSAITGQTFNINISPLTGPNIVSVSINDTPHKVGDDVTATITVREDEDTFTLSSGTIAGYSLGNLSKVDNTTYTATFTITDGGTDVAAGDDIPVSLVMTDANNESNNAFTTPISASNDPIYANSPNINLSTEQLVIDEDTGFAFLNASLSNSLNNSWPEDLLITLSFSGTAVRDLDDDFTSEDDYVLSTNKDGILTIESGESSIIQRIFIALLNDVYEGSTNETVIVTFDSSTAGKVSGTSSFTFEIEEASQPPTVTLSADNERIAENGGTSTITANLSTASLVDVVVELGYTGTADSSDYNGTAGTSISIPAGTKTADAVPNITAIADDENDGDKSIIVDILSVENGDATEQNTQQVTITIVDDDIALPSIAGLAPSFEIAAEGETAIDVSAMTVANPNGERLTLTMGLSSGTIASIEGNVDDCVGLKVSGSGTSSLEVEGLVEDINDFLAKTDIITITPVPENSSAITLTASVSDGELTSEPAMSVITVINNAPVITSSPLTTGTQGELYRYALTAFDPESDAINWRIKDATPLPVWLQSSVVADFVANTFAGSGTEGSANGNGVAASFNGPLSIVADGKGGFYVADSGNHVIRHISSSSEVTTFAGSGEKSIVDGTGTAASFDNPRGFSTDGEGNLYVVETDANLIRKITSAGVVTTFAGTGEQGSNNGDRLQATFLSAADTAFSDSGELFVADFGNSMIRKIATDGTVSTFFAGSQDIATTTFGPPTGIEFDSKGNLFVADLFRGVIHKITPDGNQSVFAGTFAGLEQTPQSVDGVGTEALFAVPSGMSIDADDNIYVTELITNNIRKITPEAVVTTISGTGEAGSVNSLGLESSFNEPADLHAGSDGLLYVADSANHLIRILSPVEYLLSGTPTITDVGASEQFCVEAVDIANNSDEQCFSIDVKGVNNAPELANNIGAIVAPNSSVEITDTLLLTTDIDDAADGIIYTLTSEPVFGELTLSDADLSESDTFTQADINAGSVFYEHDSDTLDDDSFGFSVQDGLEDGVTAITGQTFDITIDTTNRAPVISGTPATSVAEEQVYLFTPEASDPDGNELTFTIDNQPDWADFDSETGILTGTPDDEDVGTYAGILIGVSDGSLSAELPEFSILVTPVNDAPEISGDPVTTVQQDQAYSFTPSVSDVDSTSLTFSAVGLPAWLSIDSASGNISGVPTNSDVGSYPGIIVTVSDGSLADSLDVFTITVTNVNDTPLISGTPATQVAQGNAYNFVPAASDPDNDPLTFSIQNKPAWAQFNNVTGALTGTPTNTDVGNFPGIIISVTDGTLSASLNTFDITVSNVNDGPSISGTPTTQVAQDSAYSFVPAATDPDNDTLTFSIQNQPGWAQFSSATGALTGTPGNANVGSYPGIIITVSDGELSASLTAFTLTVTNVNDAPTISGTPATQVAQDNIYSFFPTFDDPDDSDVLTFSIVNQPSWAQFSTSTGTLTGTPTNANVGSYPGIVISVSDGSLSASLSAFTITVTNVNDAPTISGTPDTQVAQNSAYSFFPTASDLDNNTLTFSIVNQPSWMQFSTSTGALTGTPTNANVGSYPGIIITVSDGELSASLTAFTLTVTNVNDAPTISGTPATQVAQDNIYSFFPTFDDPDDSDVLTFSIVNQPSWAQFSTSTGTLTGTPTNANVGSYPGIVISVSDGSLSASLSAFTITVTNVNDAPTISGTPDTQVAQNSAYSFFPTASDLDNNTLTFSIVNQPSWMQFSTSTGALTGTPTNANVGSYPGIVISVSDGSLSASLSAFTITVTNVNDAPTISGTPDTQVAQDSTYSFSPTFSDPDDADVLTFSIVNQPSWAQFSTSTGALTGTPINADVGSYPGIIISVSDGSLDAALSAFTITVINVNDPPTISGTPDTQVAQDAFYAFEPTFSDPDDADVLTFSIVNQPSWAQFSTSTGALTGTPINADVGSYPGIIISVSDGSLDAALSAFTIAVINVNDPPTISGTPDTQVAQDSTYSFSPTFSDPDDADVLTFSIVNQPSWAQFSTSSGALTGTPVNNDVGSYPGIIISVSDGIVGADLTAFSIEVTNINDAPTISGVPPESVLVADIYNFVPVAEDIDNDSLIFSAINLPAFLSISADSGVVTGIPGRSDIGEFNDIVISVTDGELESSLSSFNLTVVDNNSAPVIEQGETINVVMSEDGNPETFRLNLNGIDDNNDTLLWSVDTAAHGEVSVSSDGVVRYLPEAHYNGPDNFVVTVSDGIVEDRIAVTVDIQAVNDAPTISGTPFTGIVAGEIYEFTPQFNDIDGDTLAFTASNLPAFLSIDSETGIVTGVPVSEDAGSYADITLTVSDGELDSSLPPFELAVTSDNSEPFIEQGNSVTVTMTEDSNPIAFELTLSAIDADNDPLNWSTTAAVNGDVSISDSGIVDYVPQANFNGQDSFIVSVSDGFAASEVIINVVVLAVNDSPDISGTPLTGVLVDENYRFSPTATDIDKDTLIYSADNLPSFLNIDTQTGVVTGVPSISDIGSYSGIVISVDDGNVNASLPPFELLVAESNSIPLIEQGDSIIVVMSEDSDPTAFDLQLSATDPDNDVLSWSVSDAQNGSVSTDDTGAVRYQPDANINGQDNFTVSVSDGFAVTSIDVSVAIEAVNDAPQINGEPASGILVDVEYLFAPEATDVDGDELQFSASNLPSFLSINAASGLLSGTPTLTDVGTYNDITISVTDGELAVSLPAYNLRVAETNTPPVIEQGEAVVVNMSEDNDPIVFALSLNATDSESDPLEWSVSEASAGAVSVSDNGTVDYLPSNDFYGEDGFVITVSDGFASDQIEVSVLVDAVNDAPEISGTPVVTISNDQFYSFMPEAIDVDSTELRFFADNLPPFLSIAADNGLISGTPIRQDIGQYDNILVSVSDGELSSSLAAFNLIVLDGNSAPVIEQGETVSVTMSEDSQPQAFALTLNGSDADGDLLRWSASAATNGSVSVSDIGLVDYIPVADFNGQGQFTVSVTDGIASDSILVDVTVTAVNDSPAISGTPFTGALIESAYQFTPTAIDIDGDTLSFSAANLPAFLSIDAGTGAVTGTPQRSDIGQYSDIIISVSDGQLIASLATYSLTVVDNNTAPVIDQGDSVQVTMSEDNLPEAFALALSATDADGNDLSWSATLPGNGQAQVSNSGVVSYIPAVNFNGTDSFEVTVSDGVVTDTIGVQVQVNPVNDLPEISGTPASQVLDGVLYQFTPIASDVDGDVLTYSGANLPAFLSINSSSGLVSGIPQRSDIGSYSNIVVSVSDSSGIASLSPFSLTVVDSNNAPVIDQGDGVTVSMSEDATPIAFNLSLSATDRDGDTLTWSVGNAANGQTQISSAGALSYVPASNFNGSDSFIVNVSDNFATDTIVVSVIINALNDSPQISGSPFNSVLVDGLYRFDSVASDVDEDTLVFSGTNLPAFLSLNAETGVVSGSPARTDIGEYRNIVVSVSDGTLSSSLPGFTLTVVDNNTAPVIDQGETVQVIMSEDGLPQVFALSLSATDAENNGLTWSVGQAGNGQVSINNNGVLNYIPTADFSGQDGFVVTVTDGIAQDVTAVNVIVEPENDAPVLSGTPAALAEPDSVYLFAPGAVDVDGDQLSWTVENLPSWLNLNSSTGSVTGIPDSADIGVYSGIILSANDGTVTSSLPAFNIEVIDTSVNEAPFADDMVVITGEDAALSITLTGTDPNNDTLIFELVGGAQNGVVTLENSVVTYTPELNFNGLDSFNYQVSDGLLTSALATVTVTINPVNDAPTISGVPSTQTAATETYTFVPTVSDIDSTNLQFSILNAPSWADFDNQTGELSGVPGQENIGTFNNITISVTDGELKAELMAFNLEVIDANLNNAPVAVNASAQTVEDTSIEIILEASDPDGDALTYRIVQVPVSGNLLQNGSLVTYTPNENVGDLQDSFVFEVTDGVDVSTSAVVTIDISAVNDAPLITGEPELTIRVDQIYRFEPIATDVENDTLTFTVQNLPRWANFDANTGIVTGSPGVSDVGTYGGISIAVSDGIESTAFPIFNLDVLENNQPVITGSSATRIAVDEGYSFRPSAIDSDGDTLVFSIAGQPAWTSFDVATGQLSGTPGNNDIGITSGIVITVSDGIDVVSLAAFDLEVCEVCGNVAPVINGIPDTVVIENSVYNFVPQAVDTNIDDLLFSIVNLPDWAEFNPNTGALRGTPGAANIGTTNGITIAVSDGELSDALPAFSITVEAFNDTPTISGSPARTVFQNNEYQFSPTAFDADDDELRFLISNQPGWAAFNSVTGTLRGTPSANDVGIYSNIQVSVTDNINQSVTLPSFSIEVIGRNTAPEISGEPRTAITQGNDYLFTPVATDADSDVLTFSIANAPSWSSFDPAKGTLSGVPGENDVGSNEGIVISVSDGSDVVSLTAFNITVTFANNAPVAVNSNLTVAEDSVLSVFPDVTDSDGDPLTYSIVSAPVNGSLASTDSGWRYTPVANFTGSDVFSFTASDGLQSSEQATINIQVTSVNDAPIANDDTFTLDQVTTGIYMLDVLVNDNDVDIETDGDTIIIQGAESNLGSVAILDNQLQLDTGAGFFGTVTLEYSVRDSNNSDASAIVVFNVNGVQGIGDPVVTVPDDVTVNATGLFTRVDLGVANAVDAEGNPLPVSIVTGTNTFEPGSHTVFWRAEDSFGNVSTESQQVRVNPLISLGDSRIVAEDTSVQMPIILNGDAPEYPLTVDYIVDGTATAGVDHSAESGTVTFEHGREQLITLDVFIDNEIESDETITFALTVGQNLGATNQATITISESNIAPEITLEVGQSNEIRNTVARDEGEVTIKATVTDQNPQDKLSLEWSSAELVNISGDANSYRFDPADVLPGVYEVTLFASDDGNPVLDTTDTVIVEVVDTVAVLSDLIDTDGDLIPDAQEGFGDSDGDGIPDYLDAIDDCNVVPEQVATQDGFLVESDPGVCMRQGASSALNTSQGLQVITDEPAQQRVGKNKLGERVKFAAQNLPADTEALNIGGVFDFVLYDLPQKGQSVQVVFPQIKPIPVAAVYRKFRDSTQRWTDYVTNDNNAVLSAAGESGVCPPPGDSSWMPGLTEGHWCVQLVIEDGGPNDDDGLANGAIVDPGGVAVVLEGNQLPVANDDAIEMQWNTSTDIEVLSNDSDPDDDGLTIVNVSTDFGQAEVVGDILRYTPDTGFVGQAIVIYAISDGNNGTGSAKVRITINGNRAPGVAPDVAQTDDATSIEINVLANDMDIDGDQLSLFSAQAERGDVSISENQSLLYTPQFGFVGTDIIDYVVVDKFMAQASSTVTVTIVSSNVSPVANDDSVTTAFETPIVIEVLDNDTDFDGDELVVVSASATEGSVVINADYSLTYTPPLGFEGSDIVLYSVSDGLLNAEARVMITVEAEPIVTVTVTNRSSGGGSVYWLLMLSGLMLLRRAISIRQLVFINGALLLIRSKLDKSNGFEWRNQKTPDDKTLSHSRRNDL